MNRSSSDSDLDSKAFFGLPILHLERPDSWLVDPPPFSGEHSNDPPDSDIRLDDPLLRHGREFTHAGLQKDTHYRTRKPFEWERPHSLIIRHRIDPREHDPRENLLTV